MSRGFGVTQRALLLGLSDREVPRSGYNAGGNWAQPSDLVTIQYDSDSSGVRRAARKLAVNGHVQLGYHPTFTNGRWFDDWRETRRTMLMVRLPDAYPHTDLLEFEESESWGHLEGLEEVVQEGWLRAESDYFYTHSRDLPTIEEASSERDRRMRRARFHTEALERLNELPGFCWQWDFARFLALTQWKRSQDESSIPVRRLGLPPFLAQRR